MSKSRFIPSKSKHFENQTIPKSIPTKLKF